MGMGSVEMVALTPALFNLPTTAALLLPRFANNACFTALLVSTGPFAASAPTH